MRAVRSSQKQRADTLLIAPSNAPPTEPTQTPTTNPSADRKVEQTQAPTMNALDAAIRTASKTATDAKHKRECAAQWMSASMTKAWTSQRFVCAVH